MNEVTREDALRPARGCIVGLMTMYLVIGTVVILWALIKALRAIL